MNEVEYRAEAERLYNRIEEILDQMIEEDDAPLDYENAAGVLTIILEDTETQVIISRQAATQQIWVAAKSGGFHLVFENDQWICTKTQETLQALLSRTCSEQSSSPIHFPELA